MATAVRASGDEVLMKARDNGAKKWRGKERKKKGIVNEDEDYLK